MQPSRPHERRRSLTDLTPLYLAQRGLQSGTKRLFGVALHSVEFKRDTGLNVTSLFRPLANVEKELVLVRFALV